MTASWVTHSVADRRLRRDSIATACRSFSTPKPRRKTRMAGHRKPGRPHKGPRRQMTVRIPEQLVMHMLADAERRGLDHTTWVVEAIAAKLGQPSPCSVQEALPLTNAV